MQATILLGRYYGYDSLDYEEVKGRSEKAGFSALPFMAPETIPATPNFRRKTLESWKPTYDPARDASVKAYQAYVKANFSYNDLVKYYITTGLRASQVICRNYLSNLEERNRYVQFLQDQYGVFDNVASLVLGATSANGTLRNAFSIAKIGVDRGLDKYQEYRFLNVDYEEARILVETAQSQLADYYYRRVDGETISGEQGSSYQKIFTFSDALNAVSVIESQCSRAGVRRLISKAVYATPTNLAIDPRTGTIVFRSNTAAGILADEVGAKKDGTNDQGKAGQQPRLSSVATPPPPVNGTPVAVEPAPAPGSGAGR